MAIDSILTWFFRKRVRQIELFKERPVETQDELLASLIYKAQNTEWGRTHDYKNIRSLKEFKEKVPVQDYTTLEPYIERMVRGEHNLLWPTEVTWFAMSSGTTSGRSKYIPVTREALEDCHYRGGKDLLALYYHRHPDSRLYSGKCLVMGGSSRPNPALGDDSYIGDLSSIIIKNLPFWVEIRRTPGKSVALMENWEEKIEKMARITMRENVSSIAGVPSWSLVLLKRILEITGKKNILEVWPDLELIMHGGVSFTPYREQYQKLIPSDNVRYVENYNASEGYFAVQDRDDVDDMLLMLDYGVYYEFMPFEELGKENPRTLDLSEVEPGKEYAPVISTNSGLWRYLLGDTIRFTSVFPFRIQVTGRTKHFINAFGEEVIVNDTDTALHKTCQEFGLEVTDYTAGPVYMGDDQQGAHEWLIEFEHPPADVSAFTQQLDAHLRSVNSDYDAKRSGDLTLRMPTVRAMPPGTFYEWMKKRGKLGGQNKVPRLSNDRRYLDDILSQWSPAHSSVPS